MKAWFPRKAQMTFKNKWVFILLLLCSIFFPLIGAGQPVSTPIPNPPQEADDLYHKALDAYLDGNYDKAILFAAQSLGKDPTFAKSRNLLSVLIVEKDKDSKTVIWLAGKPVYVTPTPVPFIIPPQTTDLSGVQKEVTSLQNRFNNFYGSQISKNAQTAGQIKIIQELVKNNAGVQYDDLRKSQVEIYNRIKKIEAGGQDLRVLYFLCAMSVFFSALAIWRKLKR
jgi:hypothetical protein